MRYTSPQPRVITKSPSRAISRRVVGRLLPVGDERDVLGMLEAVGDERAGDAGLRVFAGAVDVEHDRLVGVLLERLGELLREQPRAAVEVRLVHGDDAAVADDGARGGQGGGDLGRVVRVVVVHAHAADGAVQLEAALGAAELGDRGERRGRVEAEADEHGERAGRVDGVVAAGDAQPGACSRRPGSATAKATGPSVTIEWTRTSASSASPKVMMRFSVPARSRPVTCTAPGVVGGDDDELARPRGRT